MIDIRPFTAEREWTVEGIAVLTASVSLPEPFPAADRRARRIRRYYQLQCRAFLRYCENWLLPQAEAEYHRALSSSQPLPCFRAELGHQVTYQDGRLLSLYTQSKEMTGTTLLRRWGDTWDLESGYPLPLSEFLPARSGWKRGLTRFVGREIQRQERSGAAKYHQDWQQRARRFNPRNFYLTEEGVRIFYPMYAIAPAVEGIPAFLIPYGEEGTKRPEPAPGKGGGHPQPDAAGEGKPPCRASGL